MALITCAGQHCLRFVQCYLRSALHAWAAKRVMGDLRRTQAAVIAKSSGEMPSHASMYPLHVFCEHAKEDVLALSPLP